MTISPPTPPEVPAGPPPAGPPPRRVNPTGARVISILTAALGAAVIVGTVWSAASPTVAAAMTSDETRTADVDGIEELSVDVSTAQLTVVFDDVDDARLDVRGSTNGAWTLRADDETLKVQSPDVGFVAFFAARNGQATLTLPRTLEGVAAEVDLGAGSFSADGEFGDLDLEIGAGQLRVTGSADTLRTSIGAGRADFDLDGVSSADLTLSAGTLQGELTGTAPSRVDITVDAGSLDLTLPDETYAVTTDVSAGGFDNDLSTDAGASRSIQVDLSAGNVSLQRG